MEGMATKRARFCDEVAEPLDSCLMMLPRDTYQLPTDRLISRVFWKRDETPDMHLRVRSRHNVFKRINILMSDSFHFVQRLSHAIKSLAEFETVKSTMDHQEFSSSVSAKHNPRQEKGTIKVDIHLVQEASHLRLQGYLN
jgi:hypothetical protein